MLPCVLCSRSPFVGETLTSRQRVKEKGCFFFVFCFFFTFFLCVHVAKKNVCVSTSVIEVDAIFCYTRVSGHVIRHMQLTLLCVCATTHSLLCVCVFKLDTANLVVVMVHYKYQPSLYSAR